MLLPRVILQLAGLTAVAAAAARSPAPHSRGAHAAGRSQVARTPGKYWYEEITHNGISPFIANGTSWQVFRNVKDFGAKGDGVTDDYQAIQAAFQTGNDAGDRRAHVFGTTGQPAVVYFPAGTYMMSFPVQSFVDMVVIGDPLNPPVLKATADFPDNQYLWYAKDPNYDATINFLIGIKNLVLDSTLVPPGQQLTLLDWSVSQNVQLTNVVFNMPVGATGHTGLNTPEGGSPLHLNDLTFQGGNIGIRMNEQQYHLKGITFKNQNTGLLMDKLFEGTGQGLHFESCKVGVDTSNNNTGFFALIDSSAHDVQVLLNASASPTAQGSLVLQNIVVDDTVGSTVSADGVSVLTGSVSPSQSWIWGNVYSQDTKTGERVQGQLFDTPRPAALVDATGSYFSVKPPTFQEFDVSEVVNVKTVNCSRVAGDGVTDDTKSLQQIIYKYAGSKVLFFPHGTYLVSDTLELPSGTRFFGEVWSEISATGDKFKDAANPVPLIQVGKPGDVGLVQIADMVFTVADILPGVKLVEVNMAGDKPGDVGFFNSHFRIGGARGSKVQTECGDPTTCKAARLCAHLTATSSSYWENSWCWSADHDLDDTNDQNPSTAGGFLVEATNGTWLLGIGSEHNDLYQMNIHRAANVFLGFQQSEVPYWQGVGSPVLAPQPWEDTLLDSDPDFSWCAAGDAQCRMAVYQLITESTAVNAYGAGFWTFFNGINRTGCGSECMQNAAVYRDNVDLYSFGISTHNVRTLVLDGDGGNYTAVVTDAANSGGWQSGGGVMAAWLPTL